MPGAFQAGAKERLVCGFVVPDLPSLEKKRVIEGEGSGFPPEARRDGREGFGKEEGD